LKNEIDEIRRLVDRIYQISINTKGKKKNTIENLLIIEKELIEKDKLQRENEKRINAILKVITGLAQLDYNKKAIVTDKIDHIDALALGINMLGEELQSSTISLQEKEILLKEVHHRVKNNLQIVSSLLNLQAKNITDPFLLEKFEDTQNRVRSMAMVHEKLHESKDASKINFSEYIKDFIEIVNRSYNKIEGRIVVHTDMNIDNSFLKIDTAIPCALILNELISNCFKHAFPNRRKGNIYMHLDRSENNEYTIQVADDGAGLSDNINLNESLSLGLQLIAMLTEQIGGDLTILSQKGTTFIIKFKSE